MKNATLKFDDLFKRYSIEDNKSDRILENSEKMTVSEFFQRYSFHDSSITNFQYENGYVIISIELCNYLQENYKVGDIEQVKMLAIFSPVLKITATEDYPECGIYCDSIVAFGSDILPDNKHNVKLMTQPGLSEINEYSFVCTDVEVAFGGPVDDE